MRRQTTLHADWYVDPGVRIVRPFWLIDDDSHVAYTREYLLENYPSPSQVLSYHPTQTN